MSKWTLRYFGDPVLRKRSKSVEKITDEIKELVRFMIDYIDNNSGIGLAAVQVGVPIRLFVLRDYIISSDGEWTFSEPKIFINPKILWKTKETKLDQEGCLSIPGLRLGPIERPDKVRVEAINLDGKKFIDERDGINARVFFHENDHLNGVFFIDRLPIAVRKKIENDLQILKKKYNC